MHRLTRTALSALISCLLVWSIAIAASRAFPSDDAIGAILLLMAVLAVATLGDWILAVITSTFASLAFSFYFIENTGSFAISTAEGAVSFFAMLATAITGSRLSVRAQLRAEEAEARRREMERLHILGRELLAAGDVNESARAIVNQIAQLFGGYALLRLRGKVSVFEAGSWHAGDPPLVLLPAGADGTVLELGGFAPSKEIQSALASLISLVLDRARNAEERARVESIQRGEEMRNTVLNALAHNFTTPLTSIKAAASLLRASPQIADGERTEMVTVIDEESDRLYRLIRNSLDLARLESYREHPRQEICSVPTLVERVTSELRRYFGRRQILTDVPADLPIVRGDRFLLEQMLLQVMDNAWKYSAPGTRIWISATQRGNRVVLTVQNEGRAVAHEDQGRLFDKFYRGSASREAVQGTGLGLSIARSIAEAHGGSVWMDNEPEGPAFRFSLPAETTHQEHDHGTLPSSLTID